MSLNFKDSLTEFRPFIASVATQGRATYYSPQVFKTLLLQKHPFPANSLVANHLDFSNCTELTALPEGLTVQGNLTLSNCTGLTALPNWITTLGPLADGTIRYVHLEGIGLSEALLNKIRETPAPGIQFRFSNPASAPTQTKPRQKAAHTF